MSRSNLSQIIRRDEAGMKPLIFYCALFHLVQGSNSSNKSRLSLIVRVNVVLNRTVVVDSGYRFENLCGSHLQSQSELYHVS